MQGKQIFDSVTDMLGYSNNGETSGISALTRKAITAINMVYSDLYYCFEKDDIEYKPIKSLSDTVNLSERAVNDVMPYGVAMFLAQSEGDADNQSLYGALYNRKRVSLCKATTVQDVLPVPEV